MYHGAWEQDIEESDLVENLQRTVELSFSDRRNLMEKYSKLLQILSNDIQGKQNTLTLATMIGHERSSEGGDPTVDLNMALKASLLVAKSVLASKKYPKLEKDLKEVLADNEELLKEAEVAFTDKIIELVKKRDSLKNRKTYSGMSFKIRNWFLNIAIGIRNYQANSKLQDYNRQRHLDKVIREYEKAAEKISNPHVDWYEFEVPEINVGIVEKERLEINEVIEAFRIHESTVRGLIGTGRVSCFNVRGKELLKRTEIKNCLG
jgi:hypothetical protein